MDTELFGRFCDAIVILGIGFSACNMYVTHVEHVLFMKRMENWNNGEEQ